MKNHWLKNYKLTKTMLIDCKVFLFKVDTKGSLVVLQGTEQSLCSHPLWEPNPHPYVNVEGVAIKDSSGKIIWHEVFHAPVTIIPGDTLSVNLNMKFDKWKLTTLLP